MLDRQEMCVEFDRKQQHNIGFCYF